MWGNFLDIHPVRDKLKNFSESHFVEKPPGKLLEQVSDVIRLVTAD
jgi:hypothetical protein